MISKIKIEKNSNKNLQDVDYIFTLTLLYNLLRKNSIYNKYHNARTGIEKYVKVPVMFLWSYEYHYIS